MNLLRLRLSQSADTAPQTKAMAKKIPWSSDEGKFQTNKTNKRQLSNKTPITEIKQIEALVKIILQTMTNNKSNP